MTVDYKTAKHICNNMRRQTEDVFPDMEIHFILHKENDRKKEFAKDIRALEETKAGQNMVSYLKDQDNKGILNANRSCFFGLAEHKRPGFLGLFKQQSYMALFFINHERFRSESSLRNHVLHLLWHALELTDAYIYRKKKTDFDDFEIVVDANIINAKHTEIGMCHANLKADIFASTLLSLQGRKNAINTLVDQRINDTLHAERGFFAERFPFPICLDTLEYTFNELTEQYKKIKTPMLAAQKIAHDIGQTFQTQSIEQWRSFAVPAQEMAWNGYEPEAILGTAIYTGEDTYAHSVADMIAERTKIRPESITYLEDYNPFANTEVNERAHKRQAKDILNTLFAKMPGRLDHIIVMDVARKQNEALLTGSPFGWCVHGLLPVIEIIKQKSHAQTRLQTVQEAKDAFNEEINSIPWDTLEHFHRILLEYRREGITQTVQDIVSVSKTSDEFASIERALGAIETMLETEKETYRDKNITDFIKEKNRALAEKPPQS